MNILLSNYGNDAIALIHWAFLSDLQNVTVVSWDTGWSDSDWSDRVQAGTDYTKKCGFSNHSLKARVGFAELVAERGAFPTPKFQWCATLLKGVPLLQWLNQVDKENQAQIILPARRGVLPAYAQLAERVEESESYGGRAAWHPLIDMSTTDRDALINAAGFAVLPHRSLECDPCIHSGQADFKRLASANCIKTEQLEKKIGAVMFPIPVLTATENKLADDINSQVLRARQNCTKFNQYDSGTINSGCGAPYGCGS